MPSIIQQYNKSHYITLIALWIIVTGINIDKAFHIDDSFHLESAQWIAEHPGKPMSGDVVWYDNPEKFRNHNQPALLFYLITIFGEIFGYSEIPLHLLLSIFTFFALYFFLRILKLLSAPRKDLLMGIFAFCPAFIINHNLMTDIPILSLELAFFYYLLKAGEQNHAQSYIPAGFALGMALLIKYSIIPLLPVMAFAIVLNKNYRHLKTLLIPVGMLILWSVFNKIEYGGIHLLERPKNEMSFDKIYDQLMVFAGCIGAVAPFSIAFFYGAWKKKLVLYLNLIILASFIGFSILVYRGITPELNSSRLLNKVFMLNGGLLILLLLVQMVRAISAMKKEQRIDRVKLILYAWILCISGFMILFAPFMASRHILLILPCILLLGSGWLEKAGSLIRSQAFLTTAILGILLGISDWQYAGFYRRMAGKIDLPATARVWSSGHWGWQWYSVKNGMMTYSTDSAKVQVGDYLVYPVDISRQMTNKNLKLTEIKRIWEPANVTTFFSGNDFGSLYNAQTFRPSWELSMKAIDTIVVNRIESIGGLDSSSLNR